MRDFVTFNNFNNFVAEIGSEHCSLKIRVLPDHFGNNIMFSYLYDDRVDDEIQGVGRQISLETCNEFYNRDLYQGRRAVWKYLNSNNVWCYYSLFFSLILESLYRANNIQEFVPNGFGIYNLCTHNIFRYTDGDLDIRINLAEKTHFIVNVTTGVIVDVFKIQRVIE